MKPKLPKPVKPAKAWARVHNHTGMIYYTLGTDQLCLFRTRSLCGKSNFYSPHCVLVTPIKPKRRSRK